MDFGGIGKASRAILNHSVDLYELRNYLITSFLAGFQALAGLVTTTTNLGPANVCLSQFIQVGAKELRIGCDILFIDNVNK